MANHITFRNRSGADQAVKVFYGPTTGFCKDKPHRQNFTLKPGAEHQVDYGPELICYCYNEVQKGPPPEDCGHHQARPGAVVDLI